MMFPEVAEVKMGNPPIAKALCQVNFPLEPQLQEEKNIRKFRDAVRPSYPGFQVEIVQAGIVGPDQTLHQGGAAKNWNFWSVDNSWRIVLSPTFVTLETSSYSRVTELVERFEAVLAFLLKHIGPARRDRLGVRYLNALRAGGDVPALLRLVNPVFHGIAGAGVVEEGEFLSTWSDTRLLLGQGEGQMSIKAGVVPPQVALDIHPGFEQRVFGLDYDTFDLRPKSLDPKDTVEDVKYFHSWIYRAFRWSLSDAGFAQCDPVVDE